MAKVTTPWFVMRSVYFALITLFLAALLVQVYFAGRVVFGAEGAAQGESTHAGFGWMLAHAIAALPFIIAFFTKGGKSVWITNIAWAVVVFALPMLAGIMHPDSGVSSETASAIAALHPPVAVLVIGMTAYLALRAWQLVAEGRVSARSDAPTPVHGRQAPRAPRM